MRQSRFGLATVATVCSAVAALMVLTSGAVLSGDDGAMSAAFAGAARTLVPEHAAPGSPYSDGRGTGSAQPPHGSSVPATLTALTTGGSQKGPKQGSKGALWIPGPVPGGGPRSGGGLKAPLRGLLDRAGVPQFSWMLGYVVNVSWADLQPTQGGAISSNNPIDRAIAQVRTWNAANPLNQRGLRVRLDDIAGGPPGWALALGGAPVTVTGGQGQSCQVGHYWTPAFAAAYADLQTKLAALYDGVPEIREVTLSMANLCYAEPFLRYSWSNLAAAGDTVALDEASIQTMIQTHTVWKRTLQDLAFNPYNAPGAAPDFTTQMISLFRKTFGAQGVLMNNSLRAGGLGSRYDAMYAAMQSAGGQVSFQTATAPRMGDPATTFNLALGYGAGSVELPSGYGSFSSSALQSAQAQLIRVPF